MNFGEAEMVFLHIRKIPVSDLGCFRGGWAPEGRIRGG
jgi:hypothetical protein